MKLEYNNTNGLRNDILLELEVNEIKNAYHSLPYMQELAKSAGIVRHLFENVPFHVKPLNNNPEWTATMSYNPIKQQWVYGSGGIKSYKIPMQEHLSKLGLITKKGISKKVVAIGNRNLGNNPWFVSWTETNGIFYLGKNMDIFPTVKDKLAEPIFQRMYSGLAYFRNNKLKILTVKFVHDKSTDTIIPINAKTGKKFTGLIWFTYGQHILSDGKIISIEKIMEQFYDIRHVFAFDSIRDKDVLKQIYQHYPTNFYNALTKQWLNGKPRSRNLHSVLGLSKNKIFILQRFGTIEELATWIKEIGAEDAIILDNSGSVGCWGWWLGDKKGDYIFTAPDFRPNASSIIAFELKGPIHIKEVPGSTSHFIG